MTEKDPILFYEHGYYYLSNFSAFAVEWNGTVWMTAEHAYQSAKFADAKMQDLICNTRSAYEARATAYLHKELWKKDWLDIRVGIMEEIIRAKLTQHAMIREELSKTGERKIIEDSPVDAFWGRGPDGNGENHMGKIWMKLWDELREKTS